MYKKVKYKNVLLFVLSTCLLNACSQKEELIESSGNASSEVVKKIDITSLEQLNSVFSQYHYTKAAWEKGERAVPRITFAKLGERWATASKTLPVKIKKEVFFRLMAPLILLSNEKILKQRALIIKGPLTDPQLIQLALKYKVIKSEDEVLSKELKQSLLSRVDIIAPSLALAQAAEESGWGTSRFTHEGHAYFGQWDFSGKGMKPKEQRKELGNYGLARFDSPLASVEGYMFNINTSFAYEKLRQVRAQLRTDQQPISGPALAKTLDKYSERGQAYIDGLLGMISYNKLEQVDQAFLMDNPLVHLN